MQEKLKKLEENSILVIESWWGLYNPGFGGTIITKDKKIYTYTFYYKKTPSLLENNVPLENISSGRKLTDEEYTKIINFIEKEIVNKNYSICDILDAGYKVTCNYKGKSFSYENCYDLNTNEFLFDKALKLLESINK